MTAKYFFACAMAAFALTSCAQTHTDERSAAQPALPADANATAGRALFLKNCAHCHAADARGDEGPDLHNLDWPVEQIAARIRNGKPGQMTAFAGKLQPVEITALAVYVRALK